MKILTECILELDRNIPRFYFTIVAYMGEGNHLSPFFGNYNEVTVLSLYKKTPSFIKSFL